ncbi:hypothetical protein [Variovorax sp. PBL-H6]|nr:hypothetical protein [Variovorax sp. PBL-H6]
MINTWADLVIKYWQYEMMVAMSCWAVASTYGSGAARPCLPG